MSVLTVREIAPVSDHEYRTVVDIDGVESVVVFTVNTVTGASGEEVPVYSPEPDLFHVGPDSPPSRPLVQAVAAIHALRGAGPAPEPHPLVARAVQMARTDPAALAGMIDWTLSEIGPLLRGLDPIPELDRAGVLDSGLSELDAAAGDPALAADVLRPLAARFAGAQGVRPASAVRRQAALARWRLPASPAGLTDRQRARLAGLRDRAAALDDVFVLIDAEGEVPVAPVPGTERLAVRLPD